MADPPGSQITATQVSRFLLEIAAWIGLGYAGWQLAPRWRILAAIGLPLLGIAVWGVFATAGDPWRSGRTVVDTSGPWRLVVEAVVLFGAVAALFAAGATVAAAALLAVLVAYHVADVRRIRWLLAN